MCDAQKSAEEIDVYLRASASTHTQNLIKKIFELPLEQSDVGPLVLDRLPLPSSIVYVFTTALL